MQAVAHPLSLEGRQSVTCFVQSRVKEIREADLGGEPWSLQSLNLLLVELREMYFLCKGAGASRAEVNQLAARTIERIETILPHQFHSLNLATIQEMTRWGLSQKTKNKLLHIAARHNMVLPIIQHLVERGADVNGLGNHKRTPLMIAAVHANQATVDYFVSLGCNPRTRDDLGNTAARYAKMHRGPAGALPPLRWNTLFAFENHDSGVSHKQIRHFQIFLGMAWAVFQAAVQIPIMDSYNPPPPEMAISPEALREGLTLFSAGILAPANTAFGVIRETGPQADRAFFGALEGMLSLHYALNVIKSNYSIIAPLLFGGLCAIAYCMLDEHTFTTFTKVCTDIISPLAKCINIVSTVAMAFLSSHPIFAAVSLALYTISLLDSYGYLPMPVQKVYYFGLWAIAIPISTYFKCLDYLIESLEGCIRCC